MSEVIIGVVDPSFWSWPLHGTTFYCLFWYYKSPNRNTLLLYYSITSWTAKVKKDAFKKKASFTPKHSHTHYHCLSKATQKLGLLGLNVQTLTVWMCVSYMLKISHLLRGGKETLPFTAGFTLPANKNTKKLRADTCLCKKKNKTCLMYPITLTF